MLRIPHCLENRFTDRGEVVSPTHRPRSTPQNHFLISVRGSVNYMAMMRKKFALLPSQASLRTDPHVPEVPFVHQLPKEATELQSAGPRDRPPYRTLQCTETREKTKKSEVQIRLLVNKNRGRPTTVLAGTPTEGNPHV
jgi:hypothetical protein